MAELQRFDVEGRSFTREDTGQIGWNTGRPRYRVVCYTCREVVHEATTGPVPMARDHLRTCTPAVPRDA